MAKVILISQFPLPYNKIGSWPIMYNYYLTQKDHSIDIIIGPLPEHTIEGISYLATDKTAVEKLGLKLNPEKRYKQIFKALIKAIKPNETYVIQLVDNHGLTVPLHNFLLEKNLRKQCYLQFFYHGFPPFYGNFESRSFFEALDEHVVLTYDSYKEHLKQYTILPCAFSVLHNGVNSKQFFRLLDKEKKALRKKFQIPQDNLIFIWCSQDRPKKGLDFILDVWKQLIKQHKNIELWVIGTNREIEVSKVKSLGRIPNQELAQYYQAANFYLYPTLCQEGFGLSLAEAVKCGCYAIASVNGGVPEVLNYGAYGKLITNPNFKDEWQTEIEKSIEEYKSNKNQNPYNNQIPDNLYGLDTWCTNMNDKINRAKAYLS